MLFRRLDDSDLAVNQATIKDLPDAAPAGK